MEVPASPAELPAWQAVLGAFQGRFRRPEGREALERYTTGLLPELPHKHGDTSAQAVPGTRAQRLQAFLTHRPWEEEDLNRQRVQTMVAEAARGAGVLVFDETGFPKQGKASVGVARQYSRTLGKGGNGQIAVPCCDSDPQAPWPVAVRLYLPKTWASDPKRRQQTRVPAAIPCRTTPEMALMRLIRRGRGACRIAAWWPMPTMGIIRTFEPAWRRGRNRLWWRCGPTSRCGGGRRRPVDGGGRLRCSRPGPAGSGAPCAGGRAPKGGCARSSSWYAVGACLSS